MTPVLVRRVGVAALRRARLARARLRYPGVRFCPRSDVQPGLSIRLGTNGRLVVGANCVLDRYLTVESNGEVVLGDRTILGHHVTLAAHDSVRIGQDCLIAELVSIRDHDHRFTDPGRPIRIQGRQVSQVHIGDDVWIGSKATITRGVVIGAHAVVGANSVVTSDVPAWAIVGGIPARVLRYRDGAPGPD